MSTAQSAHAKHSSLLGNMISALGYVFGDICTSVLYVIFLMLTVVYGVFDLSIGTDTLDPTLRDDAVYGILSLVYLAMLVFSVKYWFVLKVNRR